MYNWNSKWIIINNLLFEINLRYIYDSNDYLEIIIHPLY